MPRPVPPIYEKPCANCHKPFSNRRCGKTVWYAKGKVWEAQKFCGRPCAFAFRKVPVMKKSCVKCSKIFTNEAPWGVHAGAQWQSAKYCSIKCSSLGQKKIYTIKDFLRRCGKPTKKGCILWKAYVAKTGYGVFGFRCSEGKRDHAMAHRVAYAFAYGEMPKTRIACHTCDNRKCVNYKHIYLGDHKTNAADRDGKQRPVAKDIDAVFKHTTLTITKDGTIKVS